MQFTIPFLATAAALFAAGVDASPSFALDAELFSPLSIRAGGNLNNETDITSNANCQRKTYTVTSRANRTVFDTAALAVRPQVNQSRITELNVEYITGQQEFTKKYIKGYAQKSFDFQVSGVLCTPKKNAKKNAPLLTFIHGIGFDGSYWNFQGPGVPERDYSFAYAAAERGYTTFRYDRLGTGQSAKPKDGYNVLQGQTEVGVLEGFLEQQRQTTNIGGKKWAKTVIIGHSYGSAQSQELSKRRPDLIDCVVLTGFSNYGQGVPFYLVSTVYTQAKTVFPQRLGDAGDDYLVTATPYSNQQNFAFPAFVTNDANALARSTEQPVTQGSLFTIGSLGGPSNFTGPVLVATGDKDFIFTFNSPNSSAIVENTAKTLYPSSKNATGLTPANLGHGIAFHTQAKTVNRQILDFIAGNGL